MAPSVCSSHFLPYYFQVNVDEYTFPDAIVDIKEHVSITIMSSTASSSALAISIFASQYLYYHVRPNAGVGIFTYGLG
jgi:hypothetical protein